MSTDNPAAGMKAQIKISSTFTDIPKTSEIEFGGFGVAERNPTALADGRVRKKPGLPNYGELKFKVFYDPNDSTHQLLRDRVKTPTQTLDEFKIVYADGNTTPAFAHVKGFVKAFDFKSGDPEKGTNEVDVTVAIDDVTAFTAGTP